MLARVRAAAVLGVQAFPVLAEADLQSGPPSFSTVGLPDEAVRESRDRVRSAIMNSGFPFPAARVTVNLAPADLRKEGSSFDLAIAVGLLAAQGLARAEAAAELLLVAELSLDGGLKPVRGVLPIALAARVAGIRGLVRPPENAAEAALETTRIHSVAGLVSAERPLVRRRPFRAPRHTVSNAGLIGGGSHPRPGEVSLAHNGVLFLDELPEFPRRVLENLRQAMKAGEVTIARAALTLTTRRASCWLRQ